MTAHSVLNVRAAPEWGNSELYKYYERNGLGYGTVHLQVGMGMSMSPQIWQQFIDLVFQDDLIKCKQNFDVIMDDTFIHLTADEHMDDLLDLFKVL